MARTDSPIDRLLDKIVHDGECWTWIAAKDRKGYGHFSLKGKIWQAHRASYELLVGPIPEGLEIDHLCRNRACVNPDHLEPVPPVVNWLRGECPSVRYRFATRCIHGHPFDEQNTYVGSSGKRTCRQCNAQSQRKYKRKKRQAMTA